MSWTMNTMKIKMKSTKAAEAAFLRDIFKFCLGC